MLFVTVRPKEGDPLTREHHTGALILGALRDNIPPSTDPGRIEWRDQYVSVRHVELNPGPGNMLRFRNISTRNQARLDTGYVIPPNTERELALGPGIPLMFTIGETQVCVEMVEDQHESVPMATLGSAEPALSLAEVESASEKGAETLAAWLNTLVDLQRSAASSSEFFQQTCKALVDRIGLDRGLVLLKRKHRWAVEARHPATEYDGPGREFSSSVLAWIEEDRKTYFSEGTSLGAAESLSSVQAVVASPILNHKGDVIGAVYGIRDRNTGSRHTITIGSLEAQMVRLLASTVAVGMARLETAANFEAFFGSELALELDKDPALLTGHEREITVLFADIRGFSRFSQARGPSETCRMVGEVMEKLSRCVRDQKGVIVSYMGDGILAMWNAPQEQPDHAIRAVRAGHAMVRCLDTTNLTKGANQDDEMKVGVGISSGPAYCGNTGSSFKFHYGPLGNTVNVASRVEGATKHFGTNMLVTESTKALLGDKFTTRRIRKVRLKGIPEPVDLFEVSDQAGVNEPPEFRAKYEQALGHYEAGRHLEAVKGLQNLMANTSEPDGPTLALLMRSVAALGQIEPGAPIEEMSSK